jgi:hypothetical protein
MNYVVWIILIFVVPNMAFAGPTTAQRKTQFEKALAVIMASATPQTSSQIREALIKDYIEAKPNKAQAVQLVDGNYFRSTLHEDQAAAGDRALEACQLRFAKPCALLAVNDEIAAEGELVSRDMPRLRYAGKYEASQIPIIRLVTRKRADVQNYDKAMEPKAMAIHPWGRVFISAGNADVKEAQETALAKCNNDQERNGKDGRCFVYAVNNDIVLPERRMIAK